MSYLSKLQKLNLQVSKAKRVAMMKMLDDGFEDKVKDRRKQKRKTLADKGLLMKRSKRQKSTGKIDDLQSSSSFVL